MSDEKQSRLTTERKIEIVQKSREITSAVKMLFALAIDCGIQRFINMEFKSDITSKDIVLRFELRDNNEGELPLSSPDPWIPTWHEFIDWATKKNNINTQNPINTDDVYWYMADLCSNLLNEERTAKNKAIEEREACLQAISKINDSFRSREWITEGRGSYPYDDERYKQEVRFIFDELQGFISDVHRQVKATTCDYRIEVEKQIKSENDKLRKELAEVCDENDTIRKERAALETNQMNFAEWAAINGWTFISSKGNKWYHRADTNRHAGMTTIQLMVFSKS